MADTDDADTDAPRKSSKLPLILGLVLGLAGAGGGFYAGMSGLLPFGGTKGEAKAHDDHAEQPAMPDVAFVPVEPLIVSLNSDHGLRHLRFRAHLEVNQAHEEEVAKLLPRVTDVLNSYLRALKIADLEDGAALVRLRAQMLRRIEIVLGRDRVNDLLIMEFVLN